MERTFWWSVCEYVKLGELVYVTAEGGRLTRRGPDAGGYGYGAGPGTPRVEEMLLLVEEPYRRNWATWAKGIPARRRATRTRTVSFASSSIKEGIGRAKLL